MSVKKIACWGAVLLGLGLLLFFSRTLIHDWHSVLFYAQQQQNRWHREITRVLMTLRRGESPAAWWSLVSLGFGYGVLHAVGPGHGKAVVSTFLLTQPSGYKSALGLSVGGALLQGVSAVLWVGVTLGMMRWFIRQAIGEIIWAERLSYILIILAGVYIVCRQCLRLFRRHKNCHCGEHSHHHPLPEMQETGATNRSYWLTMLAVGMRPCSGAILALAVAAGWGLWGVGIAMTFAMALGTGITVLTLALLTVFGRERIALHISSRSRHWQQAFHVLVFIGGLVLIVLGIVMLLAGNGATSGGLPRV